MPFFSFLCSAGLYCSVLIFLFLPSCLGYQFGSTKPKKLSHIETLYIPMAQNDTLEIKLAPQATNEIIKTISNDGSYRITKASKADGTLNTTIKTIKFDSFRSNRLDTLLAEEVSMTIIIEWALIGPDGKVLEQGVSSGSTRYFRGDNQRIAIDNAKEEALRKAAQQIVSHLANGF